jgi:hypothetical protein
MRTGPVLGNLIIREVAGEPHYVDSSNSGKQIVARSLGCEGAVDARRSSEACARGPPRSEA